MCPESVFIKQLCTKRLIFRLFSKVIYRHTLWCNLESTWTFWRKVFLWCNSEDFFSPRRALINIMSISHSFLKTVFFKKNRPFLQKSAERLNSLWKAFVAMKKKNNFKNISLKEIVRISFFNAANHLKYGLRCQLKAIFFNAPNRLWIQAQIQLKASFFNVQNYLWKPAQVPVFQCAKSLMSTGSGDDISWLTRESWNKHK